MYILIILGIIAGMMIPMQTAVNNRLTLFTKAVLRTSFYSFLSGSIILFIINFIMDPGKFTLSFFASQSFSYVWFAGGILGVIFLTGNIILLPRIGAALTVIAAVTGQMIIGILIDTFGWFDADVKELHMMHLVGVLLLIAGIIYMNAKKKGNVAKGHSRLWILLGLGTGMMPPMQTAINSGLRYEVNSFIYAAFISFLVGTIVLFILAMVINKGIKLTFHVGEFKLKTWHFAGGLLGAAYIASNISLMPYLGVTLTMMSTILGQIVMGLIIDHFGMFNLPKYPIDQRRIIAVVMIISGIALLNFF
ncbi:DMT family transporter [Oceanobacillus jeddahense]|uniref:DMT family transporter n=1 Tax=Oceanobacillus jeddahense TaxID=1462527 RepID=A0ABY5JS70_9BACI|nr:DMT family transporter [Oceanobacillus jeddahense]UUI03178.1 DMT family transporter [Oceanobacillus jeddahense]